MPTQKKSLGVHAGSAFRAILSVIPGRALRRCLKTIQISGFRRAHSPETALVSDLMTGAIDAAVRGTLPAKATLQALKTAAGVDHLERIALLETAGGKKFLFAPVGIDEGWTVADKLALIRKGRLVARRFGLPEKVGVLSGGRFGDVGRHARVDRSMADAELVARLGDAVHCEILIEDAVESCGLIIAPDGISGNLVFRTLTFLGAGHGPMGHRS